MRPQPRKRPRQNLIEEEEVIGAQADETEKDPEKNEAIKAKWVLRTENLEIHPEKNAMD